MRFALLTITLFTTLSSFGECPSSLNELTSLENMGVKKIEKLDNDLGVYRDKENRIENLKLLQHEGVRCIRCHLQSGATKNLATAAVAIKRVFSGEDINDLYEEPKASEIITRIIGDEFYHNNPPKNFGNDENEKLKNIFSEYIEKFPQYKSSLGIYKNFEKAKRTGVPLHTQPRDKSDFEWNQLRLEETLAEIESDRIDSKSDEKRKQLEMKKIDVYKLLEENYSLAKQRGHLPPHFDANKLPYVERNGLDYDFDEKVIIRVQEIKYHQNRWKFDQSPSQKDASFFNKHCSEIKQTFKDFANELGPVNPDYCS